MVLYEITLFTYRKSFYITGQPRSLSINVLSEEQYDGLSKRFNRYTHNIIYTEMNYNRSNYNINVYDKEALFYRYLLKFHRPENKVTSIEMFFKSSDKGNTHPLVIGINREGLETIYYTYAFLSGHTSSSLYRYTDYTILPDLKRSFKYDDLMTRLMEEHDLSLKKNNGDKIVVRLDYKPGEESDKIITYPKTGTNKNKITVSKSIYNTSFEKYEHKIDSKSNVTSFYLCYNKDTVYVEGNYKFKSLTSVDVYYNKCYGDTPVMIVLNSTNEKKKYKYSDLKDDLKNSNKTKQIRTLEEIYDEILYHTLKEVNNELNKNLSYLIEQTKEYSYRIKVEEKKGEPTAEFTQCTHTPIEDYRSISGSVLYNGQKLKNKKGEKNTIEEIKELQNQIFSTITVYFGKKDPTIPLIIKLKKSHYNCEFYSHNKDDGSYWEKINDNNVSETNNTGLIQKLNEVQSNLFESICIVVDRKSTYSKDEIKGKTISNLSDSQPYEINVKTNDHIKCLNGSNFKCYEHTLTLSEDSSSGSFSNNNVKLRMFMATSTNKYSEITLYSEEEVNDFNKEYIYYKKEASTNGNNKFFVIFYCENNKNSDNRPALLCYQNKVYKPSCLENYNSKWVCVKSVEFNLNGETNSELLDTLRETIYFMNPVNIDESTDKKIDGSTTRYNTHIFNATPVQITIKPKDLNCYRKYSHTTTSEYILGEISHNGSKIFTSYDDYKTKTQKISKFPDSVDVYYYLYDLGHNFPLMVVLNFSGSSPKYYKLKTKDKPLKWEVISDSNEIALSKNKIEDLLYVIRYNLGIEYEKKSENLIIGSANKCNETNYTGIIAGVISTFTLMAGAVAGFIYKFPHHFRSIYRRIRQ